MTPNIVVYDIETSPILAYAWGLWDQNIGLPQIVEPQDILCFAFTRVGNKRIDAFAAWDDYEEMLQRLWSMMDEADYLVGYNQIAYDDKHVKAAFARAGMPPPSPYRSIDLMRVVKKNFKFPSNKLAYVCEALDLPLKSDPGGFDTWRQILRGDGPERAAAQRRMLKYNKNDVKITAELFHRLLPWIDGLNVPMYTDEGEDACTRCGSSQLQSRGYAYATTYRYRRYRCMSCGGWMRHRKSEPLANSELRNA